MKELLPFIKMLWPHRNWLFWAISAGTVTLLSSIGLLAVSGWFLSASALAGLSVVAAQHFNVFTPSASVRGFAVLRTIGRYLDRVISHEATLRLLSSLRVWLYRSIEPQAPASLYRHRSGDLLGRIVTDINSMDTLFIRVLSPTLVALGVTLVASVFLWWLAPSLTVLFLLFFLSAGLLLPLLTERLGRHLGTSIQQQMAQLRMNMVEDIDAAADLTMFGAQHRHRCLRLAENERLLRLQEKMARIEGFSTAMTTLLSGLAAVSALYVAIPLAQDSQFDWPVLALITFGVLAAFEAVLPLPHAYQLLGKIGAAAARLLEVSQAPAAVCFPTAAASSPTEWSISYQEVTFAYPGSDGGNAVEEISLPLSPQSTVALVGPSGSGKTTLAHLLTRFWDPDQGRITIGGQGLSHFNEAQLRQMVTLVSQKSHIFNATLRDNLLLADPQADDQMLWRALERAQLADFVAGLPQGLETWTGEGGSQLSGGEARRLILARALLKDAPVWVLDEPTEGLDNLTRRQFTETLFANLTGKSALLITHTQEALEQVDQVCFMENGRIVACGSHSELLNSCLRYSDFIGSQQ